MTSDNTISLEAVETNSTVQTLAIIQLTYGLPSVFLMIVFLFMMGCTKVYTNSFYRLVQLDLLTNILLHFNTWFALRIEMHPSCIFFLKFIEQVAPGFLTWTKYFTWWFMHMQFLSTAVLNVHRMSSIFWPSKYEKFWTRYYFIIGLIFFIYSFLPSLLWFGFTNEVSIINGTLSRKRNIETVIKASNISAVFSIIYFVIILALGLRMSLLISSRIKVSSSYENVAKKLTKIALTYGFLYTGILSWSVITALNPYLNFLPAFILEINQNLLVFSSDLMTLSLPYILLIYDTNVRRHVFRQKSATNTTIMTTTTFGL